MTQTIKMGGLRVELLEDRYPDGRSCWVAAHPDLPECTAYADTDAEALRLLEEARRVFLRNVADRNEIALAGPPATSAHWQGTVTAKVSVTVAPTRGASPALQTA